MTEIEAVNPSVYVNDSSEAASRSYAQASVTKTLDLDSDLPTSTKVSNNRDVSQKGYIVASLGESQSVLKKLQELQANDYIMVRSGSFKDRVSVGVYSTIENAYARQDYFHQRGLHSEVIARGSEAVLRSTLPDQQDTDYPQIALIPLDI